MCGLHTLFSAREIDVNSQARALAGMIHKVGLLPAGNEQQVPFAYKMFSNDTERGWAQSVAFVSLFGPSAG